MEQAYIIYQSELIELLHDSMMLAALENGGVDNWTWYSDSLNDYLKGTDAEDGDGFYELAMQELSNYDTLDDQSVIIMKYIDQANPFRLTKEDYKRFDKLFEDIDQMGIIHHPDGSMEYNP